MGDMCRIVQTFPTGRLGTFVAAIALVLTGTLTGCVTLSPHRFDRLPEIEKSDIPRELDKASIPPYRVEPPDELLIEAVGNIRPPDEPLRPGESLSIRASGLLPLDVQGDPIENEFRIINGPFQIQPDGSIDLGPIYGNVVLAGLTFVDARHAIIKHLWV